jgi:hypothetical protein
MAAELIPDLVLGSNNSQTEDLAKMGDSKGTEAQGSSPPSGTIAKLVSLTPLAVPEHGASERVS